MKLGIPQIIYIVLISWGILDAMTNHGKPKTGKQNFWVTLIASAISMSILIWGGFFK